MKPQIQWQTLPETFQYSKGVVLSQEGRIFHVITDRTHPEGRKRRRFYDHRSAVTEYQKLVNAAPET